MQAAVLKRLCRESQVWESSHTPPQNNATTYTLHPPPRDRDTHSLLREEGARTLIRVISPALSGVIPILDKHVHVQYCIMLTY